MATTSKLIDRKGPAASRLLALAAAPTFAAMAATTAFSGAADPICSASSAPGVLTGMTAMYALMAAFHLGPWLRVAASSRD